MTWSATECSPDKNPGAATGSRRARTRESSMRAAAAGLPEEVAVTLRLDMRGAREDVVLRARREQLTTDGIEVQLPDQAACVLEVR